MALGNLPAGISRGIQQSQLFYLKIFGHARIAARFCSAPMPDFAQPGFLSELPQYCRTSKPAPWNCSPFC
ncbi:hypothetical protein [Bordetella pertussis]|uniref:hypothetical protein n=1 Tax=Bordetella pertussis TaxID=520 RepID=UPI0028EC432A|nr:hypothetical protein [Bordetella pertussis]WNQ59661.1 hypothetical protein PVZ93_16265 [Bordetella pertussis]